MAKFKKGQKVKVTGGVFSSDKNAIVRDIRFTREKKNRTIKKYIVEVADDFWRPTCKFKVVDKGSLVPAGPARQQPMKRHLTLSLNKEVDGRNILLMGVTDVINTGCGKQKRLRVGYAIQHPDDEMSCKVAHGIAMNRCKRCPLCTYLSYDCREFREDLVLSILETKASYIIENIDDFIRGKK